MYTVTTPDGLEVALVDTARPPGWAAKCAVEEGKIRAGRVIVIDEAGERSVWDVSERRLIYVYEVRE